MNDAIISFMEMEKKNKIKRYEMLNPLAKKGAILFAGSSLAEQFPIHELLIAAGCHKTVYNRGVSGDVIDGLLAHMDTLILDLAPSKLFINIGSNDIGSPDYSQDQLLDKYQEVLRQVKEQLPGCQIHILSYYPVNPYKDSFLGEQEKHFMFATRTNEAINTVNKALEQLAISNNAAYIDVSSILLDSEGNLQEALTIEGIHLWPPAYAKVLEVLLPYIND